MEDILKNIENSIPTELKLNAGRCLNAGRFNFVDFSNKLRQMTNDHAELKAQLFSNNERALHYSGDILAKTFHDYWTKGGSIKEIFIENAQAAAFYAGFDSIW